MTRTILKRWKRPEPKLLDEVFPYGKPPFDPFPTVTELTNAFLCPLAIYHYLHHGEDGALVPRTAVEGWKAGDTFHGYIARLKTKIKEKKIILEKENQHNSLNIIWADFSDFARELEKPDTFWHEYLETWAKRKLPELCLINNNSSIYFEITVSNERTKFNTEDGGGRTYPLSGRIDEIDIEGKKIIDRTIKSDPSPKDYQIWLLWKLLCSIERHKYPKEWANVNFNDFNLIVETPYDDIPIKKDNPEFERLTHEAYAWIHDLTFDPRAVWDAYNERSCNYDNRNENCGLAWMCYLKKQTYPLGRNEMRRRFKDIYRSLQWEKMWTSDLLHYKYVMRSENDLEKYGLLCKANIIQGTQKGNMFEVKIPATQVGLFSAKESDEVGRFLIVPFGNLSIGLRLQAIISRRKGDIFSVKNVEQLSTPPSTSTIIANIDKDLIIFEEHPVYLITGNQRDMHRLEFRGIKDQTRAERDSKIQLIECVFGSKPIKRDKI